MKRIITVTVFGIIIAVLALMKVQAQDTKTQTLKGRVVDAQSQFQLIGANVIVLMEGPEKGKILGAVSDLEGYYKIPNVPIGRRTIKFSYLGYKERVVDNIQIFSGKETILNMELEEEITMGDEVVITADKTETNNELSLVSARQFTVEETGRYAGSRSDPARMAANFAGVSGANDARNDIIIRGNSPTGVLWRLDGLPIANPNHFGALGSTGGPVSMLNNNLLANSDFLTGAFGAEYGNATAGVFDLQMRNGNSERREYLGQIGFNGFEFGAEGPFTKNSRASYLINYRYSTLGLMADMGFDFGTGAAIPRYQDLSFKVNVPTKKLGVFSLYGIGGLSDIDFLYSETLKDSTEEDKTDLYGTDGFDQSSRFKTGIMGFTHQYFLDKDTYTRIGVSFNGTTNNFRSDSIGYLNDSSRVLDPYNLTKSFEGDNSESRLSFHIGINRKLSARNTVNFGGYLHKTSYDYNEISLNTETNVYENGRLSNNSTSILEVYGQWLHKFNERFSVNYGVHYQRLALNGSGIIEPRVGTKYQLTNTQKLNFGYGLHSQALPLTVYAVSSRLENGQYVESNKDLDFTKSHHFVLGYENGFAKDWRVKVETYYQSLFDVPVSKSEPTFSMLNFGDDFGLPDQDSLVNDGTGYNYGVELTLEKFMSNGFYGLLTTSLFDSKYTPWDGKRRNTAFNSRYVINLLAGKEFDLSKNRTFVVDFKVTSAGGKFNTPIDRTLSRELGTTERDDTRAYASQYPGYFRSDLKLMIRKEKKKYTTEFGIDIQNVTNRKNLFAERYSRTDDKVVSVNQIGLFPVPQYRILF